MAPPVRPSEGVLTLSRKDAIAELWRRNRQSSHLLRPYQRDMRDRARTPKGKKYFSLCSRRIGKTTTAIVTADELARGGHDVRFCFPTLHQAETVIVPMVDELLATCPEPLRPKYLAKHLVWEYPNGSIRLGGADNRRSANRMRGSGADRIILDECCFFEEYEYVLKDVALPQVFTNDGTIWMLSTPPESAMHPSVRTIDECRIAGDFSHHDIWITEPYYGKDRIEAFLEEAGGIESTTAQREYFARIVTDASRAVVPEFTRELEHIVVDLPVPPRCARVVAADFGFRDLTVVVFCYYDFDRARIVVLDEVVAEAQSALEVGRRVHAKERELGWDGTGLVRIADAPPQLLADIYEACGISFGPAKKDDAEAALNYLRRCCAERRLAVHPRCRTVIAHMQGGIWNAAKSSYERSGEHGHFDAIDAVKYACRHLDQHTNPHPRLAEGVSAETHWIMPAAMTAPVNPELANVFRWR